MSSKALYHAWDEMLCTGEFLLQRFTTVFLILLLGACNLSPSTNSASETSNPAPTRTLSTINGESTEESSQSNPSLNPAIISTVETQETTDNECRPPDDWFVYTVQRGDTLTTISNRTNSTVDELIAANCLDNPNRIRIGDEILVPNEPEEQP